MFRIAAALAVMLLAFTPTQTVEANGPIRRIIQRVREHQPVRSFVSSRPVWRVVQARPIRTAICRRVTCQPINCNPGQPYQPPYVPGPSEPYTQPEPNDPYAPVDPYLPDVYAEPPFTPDSEQPDAEPVDPVDLLPSDLGPQEDERNPFSSVSALIPLDDVLRVPSSSVKVWLTPLEDESVDLTSSPRTELKSEDRMDVIVRACVRVTVNGVCGSGTIVGHRNGKTLVLTNAHVAGTRRGRVVNVQRWNPDGTSERGTAEIIAAGYARGVSVDFALLQCNGDFGADVTPIPIADRLPVQAAGIVTFGCPRCEWPSLQVLRMTSNEGQIIKWLPEAIGGRSGSSLVDFTDQGPRVVGLLTWSNGKEGMGQSMPFLLEAMRGRLPKSFEVLPHGVIELNDQVGRYAGRHEGGEFCWTLPSTVDGEQPDLIDIKPTFLMSQDNGSVLDDILAPEFQKPEQPDSPENPDSEDGQQANRPILGALWTSVKFIFLLVIVGGAMFVLGGMFFNPLVKLLTAWKA